MLEDLTEDLNAPAKSNSTVTAGGGRKCTNPTKWWNHFKEVVVVAGTGGPQPGHNNGVMEVCHQTNRPCFHKLLKLLEVGRSCSDRLPRRRPWWMQDSDLNILLGTNQHNKLDEPEARIQVSKGQRGDQGAQGVGEKICKMYFLGFSSS